MLVKTPAKDKEVKPNKRKQKQKKRDTSRSGSKQSFENHGRRVKKKDSKLSLPNISPWKVILGVILLGGLGILYLHHVFATQKLLNKVQTMEQTYQQSKRNYKLVRMKYDRLTGPIKITKEAKSMGFIDGGPAQKIIKVKPE